MYGRIAVALLLGAMAFQPRSFAACFVNEAAALSAQAQAIQALNQRFSTPARAMASGAALSRDETSLLSTRLGLVEQLIREHPEEARSVLLSPEQRTALAANTATASLVEQTTDVMGEVAVVVADDFEHHVVSYHYHLHTTSGGDLEMFQTSNLRLESLARQKVVASGVSTRSVMAVDNVTPAVETTGADANGNAAMAAASTLTCSTTGVQKTAVLLLNFANSTTTYPTGLDKSSYWQQMMNGPVFSVDSYWKEVSYGQTSASADVYGPFTLSQPYACSDSPAIQNEAIAKAASTVDFSQYTRIALVFPEGTCTYGGLGNLGCVGATSAVNHPFSVVWIPVTSGYNTSSQLWTVLAHELGHNLGLDHANTLDFGTMPLGPFDYQATNPGTVGDTGAKSASGNITAVNTEYADVFSAMGNGWGAVGPYSAEHRAQILGWISQDSMQTVVKSSTLSVAPAENNAGLRALRVLRDPTSSSWLWVEYHQGSTPYESANLTANKGNNMTTGAMIHYEDGTNPNMKTLLLDMTPTKTANNFLDGALLPGKTWSDPYSLLNVTVNSATAAGLSVSTTYDTPCSTLATTQVQPAAGGTGTLTVTAPASCSWTASSNATWMTITGGASGTGNGTVSFTTDANTTQDQRGTYLTVQRQSVRMVQQGTTITVLPDATLSPATVAPGGSKVFTMSMIDPAGVSDLKAVNYVLTGSARSCTVFTSINGSSVNFYLLQDVGGTYGPAVLAGSSATTANSTCTLSGKDSGLKTTGTTFTLSLSLTFNANAGGAYAVRAAATGVAHSTANISMGTLIVGAVSPLVVSPSSGKPGDSVQVTLTGAGTHFDATSAVTADSGDVAISGVSVVSATAINATVKVTSNAAFGPRMLTVKTGTESASAPFTVVGLVTTMTLSSNVSQALAGAPIAMTATITAQGATPTGTVTFFDGDASKVLGTANIANGAATLNVTNLSVGAHQIGVSYPGDGLVSGASANTINVSVFDFTIPDAATLTLSAGATTNNAVTLALVPGSGGFPYSINFTCAGAPPTATCSVSPATIMPGTSNASVVVTITTTARARMEEPPLRGFGLSAPVMCVLVLLPGALRARRRLGVTLCALLLVAAGVLSLQGCSGGKSGGGSSGSSGSGVTGTQAGTMTLTLTGTAVSNSVSLVHTTKVNLTVQ